MIWLTINRPTMWCLGAAGTIASSSGTCLSSRSCFYPNTLSTTISPVSSDSLILMLNLDMCSSYVSEDLAASAFKVTKTKISISCSHVSFPIRLYVYVHVQGFRKVDPDRWEFANEGFLRDQKQRLKTISRRKPSQVQPPTQPQVQHSSVGKFGLEEEVDRLQRDKNVLTQELVRLRQQQLVTEHHLQNVGQKVNLMEQRQQQMMSFLAKAFQSPGFVNQFNNDSNNGNNNRHISESKKKRRLPGEDAQKISGLSSRQQIVKYQDAYNHGGFRSSSNASDNGSSSNGANLADVSSNPGMKYRNQALETNLPYFRGSKQRGGSSGSPNSDNGECFDPIMAVLDGSMELNALNGLLDVPMAPKVPELQGSSIWEQFFGGGDKTDELISGAVDNDLIMEQLELQSNLTDQQMNHLTQQMGLLRSDAIFRK